MNYLMKFLDMHRICHILMYSDQNNEVTVVNDKLNFLNNRLLLLVFYLLFLFLKSKFLVKVLDSHQVAFREGMSQLVN